jgi:beta-lactamase superfamily II metal-dependent hydrolase
VADFFEIDFLDVETKKSGDAITLRYKLADVQYVHIVDGGYIDTGDKVLEHIDKYYEEPEHIDHVVSTHPDGDHAGGLRKVLENKDVKNLWMNRPWLYVDEIIDRFARFTNKDNLVKALKEAYPNTAALEKIAEEKGIPIREAFQGNKIGAFTVMAPTRARYLDKVVESEKTGQVAKVEEARQQGKSLAEYLAEMVAKAVYLMKAAWGAETFPAEGTSAENEMSVVQYAMLCDKTILLTADTGREGLQEVIDYAPLIGLDLPRIDRFQVPHHGSRRNVSTELLDQILGERLADKPDGDGTKFTSIISAAKLDEDHPRNTVVRAMHHRGAKVVSTEGGGIRTAQGAPDRDGWNPAPSLAYPDEQED